MTSGNLRAQVSKERLSAFLAAAGPMLTRPARQPAPSFPDFAGFARAMGAIAGPLALARDRGVLANPWALARLKRREVANAAVLAGLWSPASGGQLATEFLAAFFDRLRLQPAGATLPDRAALAGGYLVQTEDRLAGDGSNRVDVTINGRSFLVGVEVKIDAGLQPDQLGRYQAEIGRKAAHQGQQPFMIFLSSSCTNHPGVVQAGWHDVASAGLSVAREKKPANAINSHLIECFAAHVARF